MTDFEKLKLDIERYVRSGMTESNRNLLIKQAGSIGINTGQLVMLIKNAELELKFATGASNTDYPDDAGSGFLTSGSDEASGFVSEPEPPDEPAASTADVYMPQDAARPQFSDVCKLDSGAMADVYSALLDGRRKVIIKRIKPQYRGNQDYADLFFKEFDNGISLDHGNIVRFYGKGEDAEGPFYYMEYVDGRTLTEFIHVEKCKDPETIRKILLQILKALKYMHERQIFHRDLKPDNIMLTRKGNNVKIIDFGLAAADSIVDNLVKAGTPRYSAPELMTKAQLVDQRSDIYSVGMIMIEMFAGMPNRHNLPEIPHELYRCMADKATMALPDHRYQSCDEMLELLEHKSNPIPKWLEDKIKEYASDGFISRNERLVLDKEIARSGADRDLVEAMIADEIEKSIEEKRRQEALRRSNMQLATTGGNVSPNGKNSLSRLMAVAIGIVVAAVVLVALYMIFDFKILKSGDDCHQDSGRMEYQDTGEKNFVLEGKQFRAGAVSYTKGSSTALYDISGDTIGIYPEGTPVSVICRHYSWVKVNLAGREGYIVPSHLTSCK